MALTPIDKLDKAINKILEEYGDEVDKDLHEVAVKVGKEGEKALRAESRNTFKSHSRTKAYYKGWKSSDESTRMVTSVVLYNKDLPGLPHLLEYGHAKQGGGRVPGKVHISKVEKELTEKFEKGIKAKIT